MLRTLADLFWNRKTGISHQDFTKGFTILVILAMTGVVNSLGFQLLQALEYQFLTTTEHIFALQFYGSISWSYVPDLVAAPLLWGCVMLFLKRTRTIKVGGVFGVLAGLLAFLFFRSFTAAAMLMSYSAQRGSINETLAPSLPLAAWAVGVLAFCGLVGVVFFLVKRVPEERGKKTIPDSMTSQRLVRTFWLIFVWVMGIEAIQVIAFSILASYGLYSRETYQAAVAGGTGVISILGQIVLAVAFGRRLKDAGYSPWMVLVVLLSLWVVQGLLLWGVFSQPPVPLLQMLNLALFFVVDLGPVGVIVLMLLPSRPSSLQPPLSAAP